KGGNLAVTLDNTWVIYNGGATLGGGIYVSADATAGNLQLALQNNTLIADNYLTAPGSEGGGLFLGSGTVTFNGVTFDSNTASFATGFYAVAGTQINGWPGGVTFNNDSWFIE